MKKTKNDILPNLRDAYLYFWVFGVLGHFIELTWTTLENGIGKGSGFSPEVLTFTPLSPPYGIAAAMVVLGLRFFANHRHKIALFPEFLLQVVIGTLVEGVSALIIIAFLGHNPFWDYSYVRYNFYGLVCLKNSLMFGGLLLLFSRFIYPKCESILSAKSEKAKNDWFLFLFLTFLADSLFNLFA